MHGRSGLASLSWYCLPVFVGLRQTGSGQRRRNNGWLDALRCSAGLVEGRTIRHRGAVGNWPKRANSTLRWDKNAPGNIGFGPRFGPRMTGVSEYSRGISCPSFAGIPLPLSMKRAQGRPGAGWHPWALCDRLAHKCTERSQGSRGQPAFPAQWFDGLWRTLPGDEFLLVTVASRIDGSSRPVGLMHLRGSLTVATTARTTRFCRTRQRRSSCAMPIAHGSTRPAITQSRRHCPRPPHSGPRFVTTREPPLRGPEQGFNTPIPNFGKRRIFLSRALDRLWPVLPVGQMEPYTHRPFRATRQRRSRNDDGSRVCAAWLIEALAKKCRR